MLTDYERYQLEWMISHGHSLKEFVRSLDQIFDSLGDEYDPDIMDSIDNLTDAYEIWERDYGFGGEIFSSEAEFMEEDLPALLDGAKITPELSTFQIEFMARDLEDVLVDDDGCLLADWYGYPAGTDRVEIWHDIDSAHPEGYVKLAGRLSAPQGLGGLADDMSAASDALDGAFGGVINGPGTIANHR